jgi:hypothetical protein
VQAVMVEKHEAEIPEVTSEREVLGYVSAPSGKLLFIDGGLMYLWQHDREPIVKGGPIDDELREKINSSIDIALEGPEAPLAAQAFDRQWHQKFLFDIPQQRIAETIAEFDELVREKNLIARAVPLAQRISHRARIDLALEQGKVSGEVQYCGVMASVVGDLPVGKALPIIGQRMSGNHAPDASRWRQVFIECNPDAIPVRGEFVGYVAVDEARLLIADVDAVGAWEPEKSLDGLADYIFRGPDAAKLAKVMGVRRLDKQTFGWIDRPVEEAVQLGVTSEQTALEKQFEVRGDFRPHSHQYLTMQQVRKSETESATLQVGGASVCQFMTTWGDGAFEVWRDLDAAGNLVRIRIDLGNEKTVARMRKVEELWFGQFAKMAFVSKRIIEDHEPVRWLYREEPDNADDSGWRIYAGDEDQEYCDQADNVLIVPLRELIQVERQLEQVFRAPVGSAFERPDGGEKFRQVDDWEPPDEDD